MVLPLFLSYIYRRAACISGELYQPVANRMCNEYRVCSFSEVKLSAMCSVTSV